MLSSLSRSEFESSNGTSLSLRPPIVGPSSSGHCKTTALRSQQQSLQKKIILVPKETHITLFWFVFFTRLLNKESPIDFGLVQGLTFLGLSQHIFFFFLKGWLNLWGQEQALANNFISSVLRAILSARRPCRPGQQHGGLLQFSQVASPLLSDVVKPFECLPSWPQITLRRPLSVLVFCVCANKMERNNALTNLKTGHVLNASDVSKRSILILKFRPFHSPHCNNIQKKDLWFPFSFFWTGKKALTFLQVQQFHEHLTNTHKTKSKTKKWHNDKTNKTRRLDLVELNLFHDAASNDSQNQQRNGNRILHDGVVQLPLTAFVTIDAPYWHQQTPTVQTISPLFFDSKERKKKETTKRRNRNNTPNTSSVLMCEKTA